ncbi:hypothetical protein IVB02_35725 [Bradyrhizobium sp. 166]|uniref:hypothetical protein n=1 Tax=Bradyrhizobium sp. 166 TaxID=2782638 RepID=UPI001FF9AC3F|nr:hypothetical protein [Bradyrhizobium sp. 166]MCK1606583.1 hypothetical protein [Bradyrhizobium sp. 166]
MVSTSLAIYLALTVLARALGFASVLLLARSMSPADFGIYGFLQASANLIVIFTSLNLPTPIAVVLARGGGDRSRLENTVISVVVFLSISLAVLVSLLSFYFAFPEMALGANELLWFLVFTGMSSLQLLSSSALIARGQRLRSAATTLLSATTLCVALAVTQSLSVAEALRVGGLSISLGGLVSTLLLFSGGLNHNLRHVHASLVSFLKRNGSDIFLFSVLSFSASLLFQFGLWFLQRQLIARGGAEQGAIFAIGNQFYNVVLFLPGVFGPLLLRRLSRTTLEQEKIRQTLCAGAAAFSISLLGVIVFVGAGSFILLVLPSKYQVGIEPLALAVTAGALMFTKAPFSVFFQARVSAVAELFASLMAASILVLGACFPFIVAEATASLWLRLAAHFLLLTALLFAFVLYWRSFQRKLI